MCLCCSLHDRLRSGESNSSSGGGSSLPSNRPASSAASTASPSADDSDSGFHGFKHTLLQHLPQHQNCIPNNNLNLGHGGKFNHQSSNNNIKPHKVYNVINHQHQQYRSPSNQIYPTNNNESHSHYAHNTINKSIDDRPNFSNLSYNQGSPNNSRNQYVNIVGEDVQKISSYPSSVRNLPECEQFELHQQLYPSSSSREVNSQPQLPHNSSHQQVVESQYPTRQQQQPHSTPIINGAPDDTVRSQYRSSDVVSLL